MLLLKYWVLVAHTWVSMVRACVLGKPVASVDEKTDPERVLIS
jgi:hypothetical protein